MLRIWGVSEVTVAKIVTSWRASEVTLAFMVTSWSVVHTTDILDNIVAQSFSVRPARIQLLCYFWGTSARLFIVTSTGVVCTCANARAFGRGPLVFWRWSFALGLLPSVVGLWSLVFGLWSRWSVALDRWSLVLVVCRLSVGR